MQPHVSCYAQTYETGLHTANDSENNVLYSILVASHLCFVDLELADGRKLVRKGMRRYLLNLSLDLTRFDVAAHL